MATTSLHPLSDQRIAGSTLARLTAAFAPRLPADIAPGNRTDTGRPAGSRNTRVGFLLNHEGGHQAAHVLPIARALADLDRDLEIGVFVASAAARQEAFRTLGGTAGNLKIEMLRPPSRAARFATRATGNAVPFDRISTLRENVDRFRSLDALVVPEKTSLLLKTRFGLSDLRMVHTRHGAGDRAVGFDKASGQFDLVLLSGPKIRDRLDARGLLKPDGHAIVGYPKFDLARQKPARRFFDNDRPTVVYNPHPSPGLSSWFDMGERVLEYFARNPHYNLIFAPHVMLFAKRVSLSINPPSISRVRPVPKRFHGLPNIRIDPGSSNSVDMSYTAAADIYLGDASSQIYEFLLRPRPCIFLNPARHAWRDDPDFAHWQAGDVLEDIADLDGALNRAVARPHAYRETQTQLFSYTFDLNDVPSSRRAALAISAFLEGG